MNQPAERKIYLKDLHQWVPVSKTDLMTPTTIGDIHAYAAGSRNTAAVSALRASAISAIWTVGPAVFTRLVMNSPLITRLPMMTATKKLAR